MAALTDVAGRQANLMFAALADGAFEGASGGAGMTVRAQVPSGAVLGVDRGPVGHNMAAVARS